MLKTLRLCRRSLKTALLFCFMILSSIFSLHADTHLELTSIREVFYYGGVVQPEEVSVIDVWLAEDRLAYSRGGQQIILDTGAKIALLVNRDEGVFLHMKLPVDLSKILLTEAAEKVEKYRVTGFVEAIARTRTINTYTCSGFKLHTWIDVKGARYEEKESTLWVTSQLPVDLDNYLLLNEQVLRLRNFSEELTKAYSIVRGVPVLIETVHFVKGSEVKESEHLVAVDKREAPAETYSIPPAYKRVDRMAPEDLPK